MTVSKTNEQALEAAIEKALTGTSREELATSPPNIIADELAPYRLGSGFYPEAATITLHNNYTTSTRL